jgi:hypothetical protein
VYTDAVVNDTTTQSADGSDVPADDASTPSNPHQILEFFEMCCALITTLAK